MAGTTIANSTTIGISLIDPSQNPVTVASTGTISVTGTNASAIYGAFGVPAIVANDGVLSAINGYGLRLVSGGSITNGSATDKTASISGGVDGVKFGIHGVGTVNNFGTIANTGTNPSGAGVWAGGSASVVNGSTADTGALITGYFEGVKLSGTASSVVNFGTILATGTSTTVGFASLGIYMQTGGSVTNGSNADTAASIIGGNWGLDIAQAPGTVANFGTIKGVGTLARGIVLGAGGSVTNGSTTDTSAYIGGADKNGVYIGGTSSSTVVNFGTILSQGTSSSGGNNGVSLRTGGSVTNGTATDNKALISGGRHGIYIEGTLPTSVLNFGTVTSGQGSAISLYLGGSVTNGSASDTVASIAGVTGIYSGGNSTVTNFGTINGKTGTGISLIGNNVVTNGSTADTNALITGSTGIFIKGGLGIIGNYATVSVTGTGISFSGGSVNNGSAADTKALIVAGSGTMGTGIFVSAGTATFNNFGTITGGGSGVGFGSTGMVASTGTLTNGSTADTSALIEGTFNGVFANGTATVGNFATIEAMSGTGLSLFGGSVNNGSAVDTKASIIGGTGTVGTGIFVNLGTAVINNFGTISGGGGGINFGGNGTINATGTVTNGSTADTSALIEGTTFNGIFANGAVTVANFGTIKSAGFDAIGLNQGGSITNGSTADTKALLVATGTNATGIFVGGGTATISNFATIDGIVFGNNGTTAGNGTVTNGSNSDTVALISSSNSGISANGSMTVANFGTIKSTGFTAIFLGQGGSVTNGSTADTKAVISATGTSSAAINVSAGSATVTNFGTISGQIAVLFNGGAPAPSGLIVTTGSIIGALGSTGTVVNGGSIVSSAGSAGTAILFGQGSEKLELLPGSSITGKVFGGSGTNTLELAAGAAGTTGSIGSQFVNFGTVVVDSGASWTLTGTNTTGTVTNNGTLAIAASGSLDVMSAVDPASTGIFKLNSASILEVLADTGASNKMQFLGTGELLVDHAANFGMKVGQASYTGPLIENFVSGDKIDLKDVMDTATLSYTAASGLLQISSGGSAAATLAFQNSSLGTGSFHAGDDGTGHLLITHS